MSSAILSRLDWGSVAALVNDRRHSPNASNVMHSYLPLFSRASRCDASSSGLPSVFSCCILFYAGALCATARTFEEIEPNLSPMTFAHHPMIGMVRATGIPIQFQCDCVEVFFRCFQMS